MICALLDAGQAGRHHRDQPQGDRQPAGRGAQGCADRRRRRPADPARPARPGARRRPRRACQGRRRRPRIAWRTGARIWRPARPGCGRPRRSRGAIDVLFVDEAGQISLANVVAMSQATDEHRAARATHSSSISRFAARIRRARNARRWRTSSTGPPRSPPDRGLFLETTWRLHPDLCAFTSEVFYDDRLEPEAHLAGQRLRSGLSLVDGVGPRLVAIPTVGADSESPVEAAAVARLRPGRSSAGRGRTDMASRVR